MALPTSAGLDVTWLHKKVCNSARKFGAEILQNNSGTEIQKNFTPQQKWRKTQAKNRKAPVDIGKTRNLGLFQNWWRMLNLDGGMLTIDNRTRPLLPYNLSTTHT